MRPLPTRAAVIGLGTMGPGMAATLARAGLQVRCYDAKAEQRDKAPEAIRFAFGVLAQFGREAAGGPEAVSVHDSLAEAVEGADLVIESVPEIPALKDELFAQLEAHAPADCVLASCTSGIPITRLQQPTSRPGRVIGMHWSNPPHIIPMIEVVPGERTDAEVTGWMVDTIKGLGLLPVVVKKDVPGFVENRVLYALLREACDLVEEGVIEPEELDTCVSWGIGYKIAVIGPMALLDMAGLDIYQAVGSYLNKELCNREDVCGYVTERTAAGRLGIKSGGGIFDYTPEQAATLRAERAKRLVAVRRALEGRD